MSRTKFLCVAWGHRWHRDPGDFVMVCTRCHRMFDLYLLKAVREP